ncbi:MAG: 3-dehydroquinate synthase [Eubacteriales bacterium]|jgi:3-dehydroquinate synthase
MKEMILQGSVRDSRIRIGGGLLDHMPALAMEELQPQRVCVVTDSHVAPLYLERVEVGFRQAGAQVGHHILPAGEEHKQLSSVEAIYQTLHQQGLTRSDLVVALGGGVVGDITGFAAGTYLRGVKLIQVPTTLLAQVDSSVGGKCGVDLPQGKNLVGMFNQPHQVYIDTEVLDTLPEGIFADGMAEVIKYGCIWDASLLELTKGGQARRHMEELVTRCVDCKRQVVEQDENDTGLRMILNFGHTVGHGVEKVAQFTQVTHGQGVAIGMVAAMKLGETAGITPSGLHRQLADWLEEYGLPTQLPYSVEQVFEAMLSDKKKQGDAIRFVFAEKPGQVCVRPVPVEELRRLMHQALDQTGKE